MLGLRYLLLLVWLVFPTILAADQGGNLLRVHFVDVGQGDAIWIQGPENPDTDKTVNVIIDGGPDTGSGNRLLSYLEKYRLRKGSVVDYVISTHAHDDHYPGLLDVLTNYEVRTIIDPGYPVEGPRFQKFVKAAQNETIGGRKSEFILLRNKPDFQLSLGEGVEARILHADSGALKGMGSGNTRVNNSSAVIRIAYGSFSFLFMGDAEGKERAESPGALRFVEKLLLEKLRPVELRSTVLKVGHHGSESTSTLAFIRAVQPEVVVIQSGRKSFNGTFLPDASLVTRYKKERPGVTLVRTDERDQQQGLDTTNDADGDDVLIYTDGDSLQVHQSKGPANRRRWVKVKTIQK